MVVATAATIKTQLEGGTYPDNTLSTDNIFDYEQYINRRKYPSCEIITNQPESTNETKGQTEFIVGYEIKYYVRNLGTRTDEIANQKLVEDVIMSQIETMVLQDHKVVFESKIWKRETVQRDGSHPAYTISTLRITVRQITPTTATPDGILEFVLIGSVGDNPPAADYTYTNVFDVDLNGGYRDIEEGFEAGGHIPEHFAGHLNGRFIGNVMVNNDDLGVTDDKINQMDKLNTNGEAKIYRFRYTNKTADENSIVNTFDVIVETAQASYRTNSGVVYRIIAKLISDITVVIT